MWVSILNGFTLGVGFSVGSAVVNRVVYLYDKRRWQRRDLDNIRLKQLRAMTGHMDDKR